MRKRKGIKTNTRGTHSLSENSNATPAYRRGKSRRVIALLMTFLMVFSGFGGMTVFAGDGETNEDTSEDLKNLDNYDYVIDISKGEYPDFGKDLLTQRGAEYDPTGGTWDVDPKELLTIDENGSAKGLKEGEVTVTFTPDSPVSGSSDELKAPETPDIPSTDDTESTQNNDVDNGSNADNDVADSDDVVAAPENADSPGDEGLSIPAPETNRTETAASDEDVEDVIEPETTEVEDVQAKTSETDHAVVATLAATGSGTKYTTLSESEVEKPESLTWSVYVGNYGTMQIAEVATLEALESEIENADGPIQINVTSTIQIQQDVTLDNSNVTITRNNSSYAIFEVESKGCLTLLNITLDGARDFNDDGTFEKSIEGQNTSPVQVESGGTLNLNTGATVQNFTAGKFGGGLHGAAGSTINLNGGSVSHNQTTEKAENVETDFGGGGIYTHGTLNFESGSVSGNVSAGAGGGIYLDGGKPNTNKAYTKAGGSDDTKLPENTDSETSVFNMTGGTISNNTATSSEGGGIYSESQNATITGGEIVGNTTKTTYDFGGGGIFIESTGVMTIHNVLITQNTANTYGGGVAGCTNGSIYAVSLKGSAIFDNTAKRQGGNGYYGYSPANPWEQAYMGQYIQACEKHKKKKQTTTVGTIPELNQDDNKGWQDYYCARESIIYDYMLGGGSSKWSGTWATEHDGSCHVNHTTNVKTFDGDVGYHITAVEQNKTIQKGGHQRAVGLMGLTANPSPIDKDNATQVAEVKISGNTSGTNGGGITCNGTLNLGEFSETTADGNINVPLKAEKNVTDSDGNKNYDLNEGEFSFGLYNNESCDTGPILTTHNESDGTITFNLNKENLGFDADTKDGNHTSTFYMKEIPGEGPYVYDDSVYKVDITINQQTTTETLDNKNDVYKTITTRNYHHVSTNIWKLENGNDNESLQNIIFTNTKLSDLQVTKKVTKGEGSSEAPENDVFTLDVQIGQPDLENAEPKEYDATHNEDNEIDLGGLVKFPNGVHYNVKLKANQTVTFKNIPVGTAYTVEEQKNKNLPDYEMDIDESMELTGKIDDTLVTATVINKYFKSELTEIEVHKNWEDASADVFPTSITVELLRDGVSILDNETEGRTLATLSANTNWKAIFRNLPKWNSEGNLYQYTVKEISIDYDGEGIAAGERMENSNLIKVYGNHYVGDSNNNDQREVLGGWFINDGESNVTYSDKEAGPSVGSATITNTWVPAKDIGKAAFAIKKIDADNETETPVLGVTFSLTKNSDDDNTSDSNLFPATTVTTNEYGKATFEGLTNGTYILKEISALGAYGNPENLTDKTWTVEVNYAGGDKNTLISVEGDDGNKPEGFKWTNTWESEVKVDGVAGILTVKNTIKKSDLKLQKVVQLNGDNVIDENGNITSEDAKDLLKDVKFTFHITGTAENGVDVDKTAVLNDENNWTDIVENLPYGVYTITEEDADLENFDAVGTTYSGDGIVSNNDGTWTVDLRKGNNTPDLKVVAANAYRNKLGSLSLSKTVSGNQGDQNREWHFHVALKAPGDYVTLADTYTWHYQNADGTTGETAEITKTEETTDDGYTVYKGLILKHGQTAVVEEIPVGTAYKVIEAEANQESYTTSDTDNDSQIAEGENVVSFLNRKNIPVHNKTHLTVVKRWANDIGIERPAEITVQLLKDGVIDSTVTLSASSNWTHTWDNLDTGHEWTVGEINVPDGYTSSAKYSSDKTLVTVTNTYTTTTNIPDDETPLSDTPDTPEEPPVDLKEPEVPLSDTPEEPTADLEEPTVNLEEPEVPLSDTPEEPTVELDEPDVPLAPAIPEEPIINLEDTVPLAPSAPETVQIPDEATPLADASPKTGDDSMTGLWALLSLMSLLLLCIVVYALVRRKHKKQ